MIFNFNHGSTLQKPNLSDCALNENEALILINITIPTVHIFFQTTKSVMLSEDKNLISVIKRNQTHPIKIMITNLHEVEKAQAKMNSNAALIL